MAHRFANSRSSLLLSTSRQWILMDAEGQELESLSKTVCKLLEGRHKPIYSSVMDTGDNVVIINARKMVIPEKKVYWWYSGYAQGHRNVYAKDFHILRPTEPLRIQVEFKLPQRAEHEKHHLTSRLARLHIYPGGNHPYSSNISKVMEGPNNVYKSLDSHSQAERDNFVKAPDCRLRKPAPLYEWDDLDCVD